MQSPWVPPLSVPLLTGCVASCQTKQIAELITAGRCLVLVVEKVDDTTEISGHRLRAGEIKDINRSRSYLEDLAQRNGVPVFDSVESCVAHTVALVRQRRRRASLAHSDSA